MSAIQLITYLNFDGNCEAAFRFYQQVFPGSELELSRYSDIPDSEEYSAKEADAQRIMHVSLKIGSTVLLMGCDIPSEMGTAAGGAGVQFGSNSHISVQFPELEQAAQIFASLSEEGRVQMPFGPSFWAKGFGMLSDRFGVQWMVNCE